MTLALRGVCVRMNGIVPKLEYAVVWGGIAKFVKIVGNGTDDSS